jgi:hypothetical protein
LKSGAISIAGAIFCADTVQKFQGKVKKLLLYGLGIE